MRGVIVQPAFFPWLGTFAIMNYVDKFIFYDDVQYPNRGRINRNLILSPDEKSKYINADVIIPEHSKNINEMYFGPTGINSNFRKMKNLITSYYNLNKRSDEGAEFIKYLFLEIENLDGSPLHYSLAIIIGHISTYLDIKREVYFSSELNLPILDKWSRLPIICCLHNITEFYNGEASSIYMRTSEDLRNYIPNGISYNFWGYSSPRYKHYHNQKWTPNLSCIDAILSLPKDEVKYLVLSEHLTFREI